MARKDFVACPNCFANLGFRRSAELSAVRSSGVCGQCGRDTNLKLTKDALATAVEEFFVGGSYISETIAPVYQVNDCNPNPATFDPTLAGDAALACGITGQVAFHYGPPLWRLGLTDHYYSFEAGGSAREEAARALVSSANTLEISAGSQFFRVRLNARADEGIATASAFDPPPIGIKREPGRWDDLDRPVLYVADDIELCLHECRATISDEIVVATVEVIRPLKILDLSASIEFLSGTPFEDPNIFITVMCLSRGSWLDYCRCISRIAESIGFDGIRYVSYYSRAKHDRKSLNLALFGRPLENGLMKIQSVNRVRIDDMAYKFKFGPVLYKDKHMEAELAGMKSKWQEIMKDPEFSGLFEGAAEPLSTSD